MIENPLYLTEQEKKARLAKNDAKPLGPREQAQQDFYNRNFLNKKPEW